MGKEIKYYIVAADALPEIFIKVAEAKRMMQTGEADTVGAATRLAGISRSAFYKYKDSVQPFNAMKAEQSIPTNGCAAVTISAETSDMAESLETLLAEASALEGVVKFEVMAG